MWRGAAYPLALAVHSLPCSCKKEESADLENVVVLTQTAERHWEHGWSAPLSVTSPSPTSAFSGLCKGSEANREHKRVFLQLER